MEKYLIALDLDGTTLTDEKNITDKTKDYLKKLIEDGNIVVIATGRPYAGMSRYYEELNLDTPVVVSNGGMVFNPKDTSFKKIHYGIDKNKILKIFKNNEEAIVDSYFNFDNKVYYSNKTDVFDFLVNYQGDSIVVEGDIEDIIDVDPSGVMLAVKEELKDELNDYIIKEFNNELLLRPFGIRNGYYSCELYQSNISKKEGLEEVLKHYNMTSKNLIAFGDGNNDIEMLEFAYVSVAMVNSCEEVLNTAKFITREDNNNDGVIHFLDHFLGYNTLK